mgnify:CR=1 FL=1
MHKVQPNQHVTILTIEVAVPSEADISEIFDEMSALLTENGICNPKSNILDWDYKLSTFRHTQASAIPEEGEVFEPKELPFTDPPEVDWAEY